MMASCMAALLQRRIRDGRCRIQLLIMHMGTVLMLNALIVELQGDRMHVKDGSPALAPSIGYVF